MQLAPRSSSIILRAAAWALAAVVGACGTSTAAQPSCAATTGASTAGDPAVSRPELHVGFAEPTFGTCVERISDHVAHHHGNVVHVGARHQAWSADFELIAMRTRQVMRSSDSAVISELPEADVPWVWSPVEPRALFATRGSDLLRFDLASEVQSIAAHFARYRSLVTTIGLAELSDDGARVLLVGNDGDGGCELVLHELGAGRVVTSRCPSDAVERALPPRAVALSPSGRFALVQWPEGTPTPAARERGVLELRDGALAHVRDIARDVRAWDVTIDELEREWVVAAVGHDVGATTIEAQRLASDDPAVVLGQIDWREQVAISCQSRRTGACIVTTHHATVDGSATGTGLVSRLGLPGSADTALIPLAHHRSRPEFVSTLSTSVCMVAPEDVSPRATLRRDGREVLFGSSWGDHCFGELYRITP